MRRMADSINAADLPVGFDLYGGYVDGNPSWRSYAPAVARFGASKVIPIAALAGTDMGTVGDCESGDMTPQTLVDWVVMRRSHGVDPTGYTSEANWQNCRNAFAARGVPEPHWWIAGYPGSVGANLYPGSVAHQWIDRGPYDESVVADYWPGVDLAPVTYVPTKEDEMHAVVVNEGGVQKVLIYAASPQGHLLEFTRQPGGQSNDVRDITAEIGGANPFLVQP